MSSIAKKLRDMHGLAAGSCDPEFNRALLQAAGRIERLEAALNELADAADLFEAETATIDRQYNDERLRKAIDAAGKLLMLKDA